MSKNKTNKNHFPRQRDDILNQLTTETWIVSDTHFFHDNIIVYANRPVEHQQLILDSWQEKVEEQAPLLHLGDLALGKRTQLEGLDHLPGDKTLLLGNHDRRSTMVYNQMGFKVLKRGFSLPFKDWLIHFVHNPDHAPQLYSKQLVVHGHIHQHSHPDPRFINLSIEHHHYQIVWLPDVLQKRIDQLKE
jgi:calcineurin-like phosphoesterase family protein